MKSGRNHLKVAHALTLALPFLLSIPVIGQTASITLGTGSAAPGSTITLPISLTTSAGATPAALQWRLSYSTTDFTGVTVSAGSGATSAGKTIDCTTVATGQRLCTVYGLNSTGMTSGTLAVATFTVSASTTSSSSSIQVSSGMASSPTGWPITTTATGSTVTISQPRLNSLTCNPTSVQGPGTSTCVAGISSTAPSDGLSVSLGSVTTGNVTVSMPSSVTIPSGSTTASFNVQLGSVTTSASVTISASRSGVTQTSVVQVNPSSSISISMSPQSATVAAGRSQQFNATVTGTSNTSVTWSISPQVGTISSTGLYTAPNSVSSQTTVVVTARTVATPNRTATAQVIVQPDQTAPVISSLSVTPQTTSAVLSWVTNEASNTVVRYGTSSSNLSQTATLTSMVTSHVVSLSSLSTGTTYYYRVSSSDESGNTATYPSTSTSPASFRTTALSVAVAPQSVSLVANQSQQFSATVSGSSNTSVAWSISPQIGTISSTGRYTAPSQISSQRIVVVTATTLATPTQSASAQVTLVSDVTPPIISEVSVSPQNTAATITWRTDEPSNSVVSYGTSASWLRYSATVASLDTSHSVSLSSLDTNTTYYYRVSSTDALGNTTTYPASVSAPASFRTSDAPELTIRTPVVTTGNNSAIVRWMTDVHSQSIIRYGTSPTSLSMTVTDSDLVLSHLLTLTELTPGATYYYRVTSIDSSGQSVTWPEIQDAPASFTQRTGNGKSLWSDSARPAIATAYDSNAVEVGVRFRSDEAATVTGIRFYKGSSSNSGTHVGQLWSSSGTLLGRVTFTNETSSGWQEAKFASPIPISANTTYIVSYYAPQGRYSATLDYFTRTLDSDSLHAPASTGSSGNGVYRYGSSGFPTQTYRAANYWVDVVVE